MGGHFRLQNGLNLLRRVWPSGQCPKRRMLWYQLDALYEFQNLLSVFENCDFEQIVKNPFLQNFNILRFFSVVYLAIHTTVRKQ